MLKAIPTVRVPYSKEINRRSVYEEMTMIEMKNVAVGRADALPDDLPQTLAVLMQRERKKRGLSLRAGAELIGISHTELSRIEKGIRLCPSLVTMQMIANAYGLEINSLTRYATNVLKPVFSDSCMH